MLKVRNEDFRCQCYSSKSDTFVQYCYVFYVYKYFCKDKNVYFSLKHAAFCLRHNMIFTGGDRQRNAVYLFTEIAMEL